ncbi:LytTR family DNA-binding domain-containing protein [Persicitalea jodogahamensis]|uniref:LytTR family DNA-binding domain-containing protein n=1 Tax=Persicitalea jodogahamensis TaxID=402147 RepID=UPI0016732933|nr:LytTR family DNA-binding domain-containing protein [Persicitalea jodogahamensis]
MSYSNGLAGYMLNWVFGFYLPEFVSLYIVLILIENYHKLLNINELALDAKSIIFYELKFLPLFLTSYLFFIPVTLHLRFLIREFPSFAAERYEDVYMGMLYTSTGYLTYTPFIVILGYLLLNTSLIIDFLQNLKKAAKPEESVLGVLTSLASGAPRAYTQVISAKTNTGETLLNVEDCYLFETEEGEYFVEHYKGRFKVSKSLAELENELDPDRFFRGNRHYLLNLDYFDSYSYWEKGKYVLHCQKLPEKELIMPRARMPSLKQSLEKNVANSAKQEATTVGPLVDPSENS